jgi:hypothetical protein
MRWYIEFGSDLKVVGYDPENADFDRPRGEIIKERWYVLATDPLGYRRFWEDGYETLEAAESSYVLFAPPVVTWAKAKPMYGSEAYARNAVYYEAELDARERELDMWAL